MNGSSGQTPSVSSHVQPRRASPPKQNGRGSVGTGKLFLQGKTLNLKFTTSINKQTIYNESDDVDFTEGLVDRSFSVCGNLKWMESVFFFLDVLFEKQNLRVEAPFLLDLHLAG